MIIGPITGIISAGSGSSTGSEYFTSVLFPFETSDTLVINNASVIDNSDLWQTPSDQATLSNPQIISGTLVDSIVYRTYNIPADDMAISNPAILSGTLIDSIVYRTYNIPADDMAISNPTILSGSLETTIAYINYTTGAIEDLGIVNPEIISGSLA